tara:strand:- start:1844 stop:2071 length:228 start_codon:yes stop_codon:yes gene_type:complete
MIDHRKLDLLFPENIRKPAFKKNRTPTRDQIQTSIDRFLKSGGTIKRIEMGNSATEPNPRAMGEEWDETLENLKT